MLFFRRLVLLPRLVFAIELQADWKGVTQAAYHLFGPLQVEKTARHVGIGVGFMDVALIGFQDRDFGLSPVTVLLRLRRVRSDLQSAPVDRHHRHRRGGSLRVGDDVLGHQGEALVRRDGCVALVDPLLADLPDEPLDRLGLRLSSPTVRPDRGMPADRKHC